MLDAVRAAADGELVRRIAARPSDARDVEHELCRRFADRIRLYGLRHLRDGDRARDLVQTVLLAVLEAARGNRIEDPERVDRYVLGTCRNVASRVRAVEQRAQPTEPTELDAMNLVAPVETIGTGALVRCLASLDERARSVVYLSFRDERSANEIAATLETTIGNVRVLRHRAIAALRACLDEHPEVAP